MTPTDPPPSSDESTGLPGLRTWRGVYAAVIVIFATWIGLLAWLTARFS